MADSINQQLLSNINTNNQTVAAQNHAAQGGDPANKLFDDFTDFLTLLTVQLQNQDPLSPLETSEFTNQLVGFAGVEQQLAQTEQLKAVTTSLATQNQISAVSYVGYNVEYEGQEFSLQGDTAKVSYQLPENIGGATLSILDEEGALVAAYHVPHKDLAGKKQDFVWDGYRVVETDNARVFRLVPPAPGQDPQAVFDFKLPRNTDNAQIHIRDANGVIVRSDSLIVNERRQTYKWDAQGTINGVNATMPSGTYSYEIEATAATGGPPLIDKPTLYEIMPIGNYQVAISLLPATGQDGVEGTTKYYSKSRAVGIETKDGNITLKLATGKELAMSDVLSAEL